MSVTTYSLAPNVKDGFQQLSFIDNGPPVLLEPVQSSSPAPSGETIKPALA